MESSSHRSGDVATNPHVDALVERIMSSLREDLRQQTRTFIVATWMAMVTAALGAAGWAFAAARLV